MQVEKGLLPDIIFGVFITMDKLAILRREFKKQKIDALLVSSYSNILYLTQFFGFSENEREAYLLITATNQYLITDSRYTEAVKGGVIGFELIEISSNLSHHEAILKLVQKHQVETLGVEEHDLTVSEHKKISGSVKTAHYSPSRAIKTSDEIEKIQKACSLGDLVFEYMLKVIKPGRTEKDLAWEMEKFVKINGSQFSFDPIIAFNEHAAMPHHQISDKTLPDSSGQLILMDFGVKIDGFCSDMTRVVFLGKATQEQKQVYSTVISAQEQAVAATISHLGGVICAPVIDKAARDYIEKKGFIPFGHGLGHGVGLEVHEAPRVSPVSRDKLVSGMVFSIEPGIYLPGRFGVRIEDLFTIQGQELVQLTHAPKDLIEL